MNNKRVLWLEDEYEDLSDFLTPLYREGYLVDPVKSVSEAIDLLRSKSYFAVIFDIKVHPGDRKEWIDLDNKKRKENPKFDSYLGLELLRAIFVPNESQVKLKPSINLQPERVIIFTVVDSKEVSDEIASFGVPKHQIQLKARCDLTTLKNLLKTLPE